MLHRLEFRAMGCDMLAVVDSETQPAALSQFPEWFEAWEQCLSRFRYDSELTRFNQTHEQPVPVSETFWEVFQAALRAEEMTYGLVTPTLLNAIIDAGYDRPFDDLPHLAPLTPAPALTISPPLTAVAFDESARTITLPFGMGLDFGGVAKGWAAHQAMLLLQTEDTVLNVSREPVLIDAGGDIAISGPRTDGSLWQVGIADPFNERKNLEVLYLNACGVATSGKNRRRWVRDGNIKHHIIDPGTNQPVETDLLTVTVIAPDVMKAEAAAKAAFILGSHAGFEWLEAHPEFAGVFVLDNSEILYTPNMDKYL